MTKLTIIVPVKNEQESIELFLDALFEIKDKVAVSLDVLFVDDGSTDNTLQSIDNIQSKYDGVISTGYISLSRNFGKEAAMYAGLEHASGDLVAFMDVDLQDPVYLLPEMVDDVLSNKYDAVAAKRVNRDHEAVLRSKLSDMFYWFMNKISGVQLEKGERDFRVMNRQVVSALLSLGESKRFSKGMFHWVGFNTKYISYDNEARLAGTSSWSMSQLIGYAIDGIVGFSMKPLLLVSMAGMLLFGVSLISILFVIIRALVDPSSSAFGWASLVSIVLLVSGLQLMSLGVIGRYISDIFIETKNRPQYIIKKIKKQG